MDNDEREDRRAFCRLLFEKLRADPTVPQAVFELINEVLVRLDRLEMGNMIPEERPTRPDRKMTPKPTPLGFRAITVTEILKDGKK